MPKGPGPTEGHVPMNVSVIQSVLEQIIRNRNWDELRHALAEVDPADIAELILDLPDNDDVFVFRLLTRDKAAAVFSYLPLDHQENLLRTLVGEPLRALVNDLTPDDRTHLFRELPAEVTRRLIEMLSPEELKHARSLLGYPPESAGHYMTPEYVILKPQLTARQALEYIRTNGKGKETLNILYVVDDQGALVKDIRLGTLVMADPEKTIAEIEDRPLVSVSAMTDREEVLQVFEKYDRVALPVVDDEGHMLGIITSDDMLDISKAVATEDIQKIGGMEALGAPYLTVGAWPMLKKRAGWLSALFLGEMLTASAMSHFQDEIANAVILALFVPLIISSGGNSGSQAATLIVRALAVRELALRDWFVVMRKELLTGLSLGGWLGLIGFLRVVLWQHLHLIDYGPHYVLVAMTVWLSLIGVVLFGSLVGAMLPLMIRRLGFDPAASSAPFVATLVDVTGLVIYFSIAAILLRGTLL